MGEAPTASKAEMTWLWPLMAAKCNMVKSERSCRWLGGREGWSQALDGLAMAKCTPQLVPQTMRSAPQPQLHFDQRPQPAGEQPRFHRRC